MPRLPSINLSPVKGLIERQTPPRELPNLREFAGAVAFDLLLGEPPNKFHPVVGLGKAIETASKRELPGDDNTVRLAYGAFMATVLPFTLTKAALEGTAKWKRRNARIGLLARIYLLKSSFSIRKLTREAKAVQKALDEGDIEKARERLSSLVSRDRSELDRRQIISATVESLAENLTDGIVGPLIAYAAFGLPGALTYRTINTMDAMIGYHEGHYEQLGKAAARLDDIVNFLPARLSALLIASTARIGDGDPAQAFRTMWRDRTRTESPNAGWTMAAMAGALGVQLENPGRYVLGDPTEPLDTQDIDRATRIVHMSTGVIGIAVAAASAIQSFQNWRRLRTAEMSDEQVLPAIQEAVETGQ
jgi:adenosylcobinamide-phosphate synthase